MDEQKKKNDDSAVMTSEAWFKVIKSNQSNQNYFIYPRGEIQLVCLLLN